MSVSRPPLWLLAGFVLAALIVYSPASNGTPVWDDDAHLTSPDLSGGTGLTRIWTELGATQQYYPAAHSAFWIMNALWGHAPLGYHVTSIVLHAIAAWLLVWLLLRLVVPGAMLAGAIFLVHPVHVESVAWISELKNTLSGVCYLAAALCYWSFDATRRRSFYTSAFVFFLVAVLSKSVTASLPAALAVLLWWSRGRLRWRDLAPLVPFAAVGLPAGILTAYVERHYIGAQGVEFALSLAERVLVAGRATLFYLGRLAWPVGMSFVYPKWTPDALDPSQYLFPLAVVALVAVAYAVRRRTRGPLAAVLLFLGTLSPALGFVDVFPFRYSFVADHFVYLASIPILALIAAAATRAVSAERAWGRSAALVVVLGLPLGWATFGSSQRFADVETLYTITLDQNPSAWMAYNNLAKLELERDEPDLAKATSLLTRSLAIYPDNAEAHNNLGTAYQRAGRFAEAYEHHLEAVRLAPGLAQAHNNLGIVALRLGNPAEARLHLENARRLDPRSPETYYNIGLADLGAGEPASAVPAFQRAIQIRPDFTAAHFNLGLAYEQLEDWPSAVSAYQAAAGRDASAPVLARLGYAQLRSGRPELAVANLQAAIVLDPSLAEAHRHLGDSLTDVNRLDDAVAAYRAALAVEGENASAETHNNLGIALAMLGRTSEAAHHFRQALRVRPGFEEAKRNLRRIGG